MIVHVVFDEKTREIRKIFKTAEEAAAYQALCQGNGVQTWKTSYPVTEGQFL